jgi:hypothetical protein
LTRNSRIEEDLIDQLFNSSEKRLARLLLLLANFGTMMMISRFRPELPRFSGRAVYVEITSRREAAFFNDWALRTGHA